MLDVQELTPIHSRTGIDPTAGLSSEFKTDFGEVRVHDDQEECGPQNGAQAKGAIDVSFGN
jgi:hypothetical protein